MAITKVPKVMTEGLEELSNKSTDTSLGTSDTLYPSQKAVKDYADTAISTAVGGLTSSSVGLSNVTNDAQLKRAANDFTTFTEKVTPVNADVILIEDSNAGAYVKKYTTVQSLSPAILNNILFVNYTFSGDGINSTFLLGAQIFNPLSGVSNIAGVYLNGIMQVPDEDYFVQLPSEIVFYAIPPITSKVHVVMVSL